MTGHLQSSWSILVSECGVRLRDDGAGFRDSVEIGGVMERRFLLAAEAGLQGFRRAEQSGGKRLSQLKPAFDSSGVSAGTEVPAYPLPQALDAGDVEAAVDEGDFAGDAAG